MGMLALVFGRLVVVSELENLFEIFFQVRFAGDETGSDYERLAGLN
jgi:hypothetical protein